MIVKIYKGHFDDPKADHDIFQWVEDVEFYVQDGQPLAKLTKGSGSFIRQIDGWAVTLTDCGQVISHYRAIPDKAKITIAWDRAKDELRRAKHET